ncbi:MAG: DVUA0089 family protein [Candidatus Flexifilum sp.]
MKRLRTALLLALALAALLAIALPAGARPTGVIAQVGSSTGTTVSVTGSITRDNTVSRYAFIGIEGDVITLTATAQPTGSFDPVLSLFVSNFAQPIARNDDHGTSDPALATFDSRIASFTLPMTGLYTVEVTSFAGLSAGTFRLDLTVERSAAPQNYELTPVGASASLSGMAAGPTPTSASLSGMTAGPTPTSASLSGMAAGPTPTSASLSGMTAGPTPTFASLSGMTAGERRVIVVEGALTAEQNRAVYGFTGAAGDIITLTLTSGQFDTVLSLFAAGQPTPIARNDDHGTTDPMLGQFDSRIASFALPTTGAYTIEATSFSGRTPGDYVLTLTIEQAADPAAYQLEPLTPTAPPVSQSRFVPPALTGTYTTPDGVTIPVPEGWLTRETLGGTILANTQAVLDGAANPAQTDYSAFGPDGIALQIVPRSLVTVQPGQSAAQVLSELTGVAIGQTFALTAVGAEAAVVRLEEMGVPSGIEAYAFAVDYADGPAQDYVVFLLATAIPANRDLQVFFEDLFSRVTTATATASAQPTTAPATAEPQIATAEPRTFTFSDGSVLTIAIPGDWTVEVEPDQFVLTAVSAGVPLEQARAMTSMGTVPDGAFFFSLALPGALSGMGIFTTTDLDKVVADLNAAIAGGQAEAVPLEDIVYPAAALEIPPDNSVSIMDFIVFITDGGPMMATYMANMPDEEALPIVVAIINSIVYSSANAAAEVTPEAAAPLGEPQTFTFSDGSQIRLALPPGWLSDSQPQNFVIAAGSNEAALDYITGGNPRQPAPAGTIALQLGTSQTIEGVLGTVPTDPNEAATAFIRALDATGTPRPLTTLRYPAAIADVTGDQVPSGLRIVLFQVGGEIILLGYVTGPDIAVDDALPTISAIIDSIEYTAAR